MKDIFGRLRAWLKKQRWGVVILLAAYSVLISGVKMGLVDRVIAFLALLFILVVINAAKPKA